MLARVGAKVFTNAIMQFENVTAIAKANLYFAGKVISHTIVFADGSKKTLGIIHAGIYHFDTSSSERMEIIDGACNVQIDHAPEALTYPAGTAFEVPAQSGFTIAVEGGTCQYVCSFLE